MALYFIQQHAPDGPIKIGISINVENRFRVLQTANPDELTIIGVMKDCHAQEERWAHNIFQEVRKRGEWFFPVDKLRKCVENCSNKPKKYFYEYFAEDIRILKKNEREFLKEQNTLQNIDAPTSKKKKVPFRYPKDMKDELVKCTICDKKMYINGVKLHFRGQHPEVRPLTTDNMLNYILRDI